MGFRSFSWAEASAAVITFVVEVADALLPAIDRLATVVVVMGVAGAIARALGCLDFSFG